MLGGANNSLDAAYVDKVESLSRARARLRFDPYVDIDWKAPENALAEHDPRWQLDPAMVPLATTDWYAAQPLKQRIDMGRWLTANMLKVTLQFEMMLIRGVVHYADKQPNGSAVSQYLISEISDECNHIQMFQEFINRAGEDVPGMRRPSRIIGPILGSIGGYASTFLFIGVLCGEQPLHFQQTLQHRGTTEIPPLLNRITYIHLAEEARHISFADIHLANKIQKVGFFRRALYTITFPFFVRWLISEMIAPPRSFARQFGVPRRVIKSAYWGSPRSRQMLAESAADVRLAAEQLGLRPFWSLWLWVILGIDGRLPRYRGEPDRSSPAARATGIHAALSGRGAAATSMTGIALAAMLIRLRVTRNPRDTGSHM